MNTQKLYTTVVGAFFTVLLTFNISAQESKTDVSDFLLFVEKTDTGVALKCVKGCAWTDLSFSLNKVKTQAIDEFGMRDNSISDNKTEANFANFLFTIRPTDKGFTLKSIEGSVWKDLSFSLENQKAQAINAKGMLSAQ